MKTEIKLNIINKKTKEIAKLSKFYDFLLPLNRDDSVITGIYYTTISHIVFDVTKDSLIINLIDEYEENENFHERIELLRKYEWL